MEIATGLNRSSLYNAFGDKKKAFLLVLENHRITVERRFLAELNKPDIVCALRSLLEAQIASLSSQKLPAGCLTTNSCTEIGCHGRDFDEAISGVLEEIEHSIYKRLQAAKEDGQLKKTSDIKALSRFVVGISRTIPLMFRATGDIDYVRDIATTSLTAIGVHLASSSSSSAVR